MDRITDLLTELSIDPFKQERYARDPELMMDEAGLSAEERHVLASWTQRTPGSTGGPWARCACCFDPGPDPLPTPDPPGATLSA